MRGQGAMRGKAYDSLARAPLADAQVWVRGTRLRTVTDSGGRFRFDTLPEGRHVLVASHSGLTSAGLDSITASVIIETGRVATALLATPSLNTIWSRYCPAAEVAAADSGVVMGLVTDKATGKGVAGVAVVANWLAPEARSITVRSDSLGRYYHCGLPVKATLELQAHGSGDYMEASQVRLSSRPLARRDFSIVTAPPRNR